MTTTAPALPVSLFTAATTAHDDCTACNALAVSAASLARAIGSAAGRYGDGVHGVVVRRVTRP